jgi:hypothetical protein
MKSLGLDPDSLNPDPKQLLNIYILETLEFPKFLKRILVHKYLLLVGFGRACAPVRCTHPSFWAH